MRWAPSVAVFVLATAGMSQTTPKFDLLDRNVVRVQVHRDAANGEPASDETGTGVVVTINPGVVRVLTAAHVVRGASTVHVAFVTDKVAQIAAKVLPTASDALDLAMLEVVLPRGARLPDKFLILQATANAALQQTEHVWTVNGDWDPVPNTVVHLAHQANAQQFEYTRVSLGEGYSGGPVFDDGGHLVGIHTSETGRGDYTLGVAVKIESALETLEALQYTRASINGVAMTAATATRTDTRQAPSGAAPVKHLWRDLNNNQLYEIRTQEGRVYIAQSNGNVVADLALKTDKSGAKKYVGTSSLSNCPGSGYMEIVNVTDSRIDGRVELKPAGNNVHCGGVMGIMRQMTAISFIPEPGR